MPPVAGQISQPPSALGASGVLIMRRPVCFICKKTNEESRGDVDDYKRLCHIPICHECASEIHSAYLYVRFGKRMKLGDNYKAGEKTNIPNDIRWEVFERDNFTCKKCGSRRLLCIDHIFPEALGGKMSLENLQTLCKSCNSRKGKRVEYSIIADSQ